MAPATGPPKYEAVQLSSPSLGGRARQRRLTVLPAPKQLAYHLRDAKATRGTRTRETSPDSNERTKFLEAICVSSEAIGGLGGDSHFIDGGSGVVRRSSPVGVGRVGPEETAEAGSKLGSWRLLKDPRQPEPLSLSLHHTFRILSHLSSLALPQPLSLHSLLPQQQHRSAAPPLLTPHCRMPGQLGYSSLSLDRVVSGLVQLD